MILVENGPLSHPGPAHLDLSLRLGAGARNGLGKIMSLKVRVVLVTVMFRLESCSPRSCSWSLALAGRGRLKYAQIIASEWIEVNIVAHRWPGMGGMHTAQGALVTHSSSCSRVSPRSLETAVRTVSLKTAQC